MINFNYSNNAYATFAVAVTEATTTFVLGGKYGLLPSTNGKLTCIKRSGTTVIGREIIFYTARTTNTLTGITRAYEACPVDDTATAQVQTPLTFAIGDTLELIATAKDFDNFETGILDLENGKVNKSGDTLTGQLKESKGVDIASAATVNLGTVAGNYVHITGTTTITSFGTTTAGTRVTVVFDNILTITYNATSLILPGVANITTAAGDSAVFESEGSGNWKCVGYMRQDGTPVVNSPVPLTNSQIFTASGTWTKPTNVKFVEVICIGAGGGGGSGRADSTSGAFACGGGGGGGGAVSRAIFLASSLSATESVTVGSGGVGGTSVVSINNGNAGSNGTSSLFGTLLRAGGGGGGAGGTANGVAGGGSGSSVNNGVLNVGGVPSVTTIGGIGGQGANGGAVDVAGLSCEFGGGSGAGSANNANSTTLTGGSSIFGAGGGGAGGGINNSNISFGGGAGGIVQSYTGGGGGAGGASSGGAGTAGSSNATTKKGYGGDGGGGGGGNNGAGGIGGAGGIAGGAGGGGGGGRASSGAGGAGARGEVRVYSY